jgi:twitching motility protein PilI
METHFQNDTEPQSADGLTSSASKSNLSAFANQANSTISEMFLGFRVGDFGFLLPVSLHCEVAEQLPVNPLPNVEPWFSGLLNIRGNIVPVVDLLRLMSDTASHPKKRYLFAMDRGEKTMAVWIDGYPQMLGGILQPLNPLPQIPERLQCFVTNAYAQNGQIWLKVQFEQLFKTLGRQSTVKEAA